MKKLFAAILTLSSFVFVGAWNEKATNAATMGKPQVTIQLGRRRDRRNRDWWWRNRARGEGVGYGRVFTRDVQYGRRIYRETYQVQNLPFGGTRTVLISRTRLN